MDGSLGRLVVVVVAGLPAACGGYCCDCQIDCPGVGGDWCVDDEHGTCHGGCGAHICP